jgi:hypothetical protein
MTEEKRNGFGRSAKNNERSRQKAEGYHLLCINPNPSYPQTHQVQNLHHC